MKYISSNKNEYSLYSENMRVMEGSFHKYTWTANSRAKKIGEDLKEFKKEAQIYELTFQVRGELEKRKEILDKLHDDFEHDINAKKPGRMIFGGYYIEGYCIESSTNVSEIKNTWSQCKIVFYCPYPFWIKEHPYSFKKENAIKTNGKRYAYRYAYRYANGLMNTAVVNDHYADCNFRMIIYGPIIDPMIYIGGHPYFVHIILEDREYLEIDSAAGTVVKVTAFGERVNAFNNRSFTYSVFEPVHPGRQMIGWSGLFNFDLTLYEERSEPKWGSKAEG